MKAKNIFFSCIFILLILASMTKAQWVPTSQPLGGNVTALAINSRGDILAGSSDGVFCSTDNGSSWTQTGLINIGVDKIAANSNGDVCAVNLNGVYLSTDNGDNWKQTTSFTNNTVYAIAINNNGYIFAGTYAAIFRSKDNGDSWNQTSLPMNGITSFAIDSSGNIFAGTYYGADWGNIFRTKDSGDNWNQIDTLTESVSSIAINSNGDIFAGTDNGGVYLSTDHGDNWNQTDTLTKSISSIVINNTGDVFAGTNGDGVFLSTDNGDSWNQINTGLTNFSVVALAINVSGYIFAITYSGGVWHRPLDEMIGDKKTPVIFIPGSMGSPLFYDQDNNNSLYRNPLFYEFDEYIWADAIQTTFDVNDTFLDVLQLSDNGIDPMSNNYRIKVAPLWGDSAETIQELLNIKPLDTYKNLISRLQSNTNNYTLDDFDTTHNEGENLYVFTYDWRKSISNAALELKNLIVNIKTWNNVDKVNLVCHSMGGLVAKRIIDETTRSSINKIIFVATPHQGAPKILSTLATGKLFGFAFDLVFNNNEMRKIARNMPSGYHLMPSSIYTNTNINNGENTQRLELYEYAFQYPPNITATYQQMLDYYNTVVLPSGFIFNYNLNNQGHVERQLIENVDFGDIDVYNIVGFNERTIGVVENIGDKFNEKWNLTGDGTVPLRSAEIVNLTNRKADFYVKNVKHDKLPSSEAGMEIIQGLLKEPSITQFSMPNKIFEEPPESYALSLWQAIVSSPVSLHAYDSQGNHTGAISDTTWEINIPNSEYFHGDLGDPHSPKSILLAPDLTYYLKINSLDTTSSFDLVIDKIMDGYSIATVYFDSVEIQNQTVAICSLTTSNQIFELGMDYDGNSIIDSVITPSKIVDVDSNDKLYLRPTEYELSQNYPNPFNPTTTIKYSIPFESIVNIKIYDIIGREVKTLVNEEKQAGNYQVEFDGSKLSSGVYFYSITANNFYQTKKMILVK